jgi:hypothetical protein
MTPSLRHGAVLSLAAVVALLAVGCGDGTTPTATAPDLDPDTPVLVVGHEGGFGTPEMTFTNLPHLVVYGDGRVVYMGAQILIYPGPALPPLRQATLSDEGLDRLLEEIESSGLDERDVDYGHPPVADAGQTVVSVQIGGTTYEHRAEALGLGEQDGVLDDDQLAARARLSSFVERMSDWTRLVGEDAVETDVAYPANRFRLQVRDAANESWEPEPSEPQPGEMDWRVPGIELEETNCLAVDGDAAADLGELLAAADQLTRFVTGDRTWIVTARPVLPHEDICPPL